MNYIPYTTQEIKEMLKTIGVSNIEDLFTSIPKQLLQDDLDGLPEPTSEIHLQALMESKSKRNDSATNLACLMGGGIYDHYIPLAVDFLANRSEFYTAYTPYQPEASQGTLQAIFEYQTLISRLTSMEISNASLYDGASAMAEAVLVAFNMKPKTNKVILSQTVHLEYIQTVDTYIKGLNKTAIPIPYSHYQTDWDAITHAIDDQTACVCLQYPNFFGHIEDLRQIEKLKEKGIIIIVAVYPIALGKLKSPADFGADIIVGEGQSLGNPMGYGGPHFGFFTTKQQLVRKLPGRIVGETIDHNGKVGYCLTFQTREQHIRREKATSNICTNQALCALRALIYLALLGEKGLKQVAEMNYQKAHLLAQKIDELEHFKVLTPNPFYNEFVVECDRDIDRMRDELNKVGFLFGIPLKKFFKGEENKLLISVTEKRSKNELIQLINFLKQM